MQCAKIGLLAFIVVVGLAHKTTAIAINGTEVSIDEAIIDAATQAGADLDEMMPDSETVRVELDILYNIDTYIKISNEQAAIGTEEETEGRKKRKAIIPVSYRWEDGRVPYEISNDFSSSERQLIQDAIDDYNRYTCIRFVPATRSDSNRVRFQNGRGCSSYVGMIGRGVQAISLAPGCRYKGIIIHEMGHAIGFQHEQTRPDRDDFVSIEEHNIQDGKAFNFRKYTTNQVDTHNIPYDYTSVMHYGQWAFSKNGRPTIVARDSRFQTVMGNREGLSFKDIQLANEIYQCAERSSCRPEQCPEGSFQGQNCECLCDSGNRSSPVKECDFTGRTSTTTTRSTTTTTTTTTEAPVACEDDNVYCGYWTRVGYCQGRYERYMRETCKLSCGYCTAA